MKTILLSLALVLCASQLRADDPTDASAPAKPSLTPPQLAIMKVLKSRMDALQRASITHKFKNGVRVHLNQKHFVEFLDKIDTTSCSKNFRLAWFDYVTTWKQHRKDEAFALIEVGAVIATGGGSALVTGAHMTHALSKAERDDPNLAWRAVERACLELDIDAEKIN